MPKVTFIKDGKETTVEFEHGKLEIGRAHV